MLAQNFKTPAELHITDDEFNALVKVLGMLERGEIAELPRHATMSYVTPTAAPTMFYMRYTEIESDCGTACCILGWAQHVGGRQLFSTSFDSALGRLFAGRDVRDPELGARALRNYLTTGEANWYDLLNPAWPW